MYVGGCEVWGSGFGRSARPILTISYVYIYYIYIIYIYTYVCVYLFMCTSYVVKRLWFMVIHPIVGTLLLDT